MTRLEPSISGAIQPTALRQTVAISPLILDLRLPAVAIGILTFVAACGAGSPTQPTAPTPTPSQTVSSVSVTGSTPAVGAISQFSATATLSDGTTQNVTGQAGWQSSNQSVATVSSGGVVSAIAPGETDITATFQSVSGKTHLTVPISLSPAATLPELIQLFIYRAEVGRVRVSSDISVAFSQEHAAHASLVWNYFLRLFARPVGVRTEMYYTMNLNLYAQVFRFCPSVVIPGARQLTACYDQGEGIYRWFIVPYTVPDFGTQLHELSHGFLYGTYPASEDFPWIKEGTGMYWESGSFDGASNLVVTTPHPYLTTGFHRWHDAGQLLPLTALVSLPRAQFYARDPTLVYSQAGMFIFYLMQNYPSVMTDLFGRLNSRSLTNNDQVLAFLTGQTGLSLQQLDAAYVAFSLRY